MDFKGILTFLDSKAPRLKKKHKGGHVETGDLQNTFEGRFFTFV